MDTSKEYIEMRIKAIPLMGRGDPPRLPFTLFTYYDSCSVMVDAFGTFFIQDNTSPYICILERQDQLQDMVAPNNSYTSWALINRLYDNLRPLFDLYECYSERGNMSMEQLWLTFVMHEKYGKKWDGQEWAESLPHPTKSAPVVDENEGK